MTRRDTGNDVPTTRGASAEQGIIPGDASADMVATPEIINELQPAKEADQRPWHKRPSMWWILPVTVVNFMVIASTIAPRTELYIKFACDELRPEYRVDANAVQWRPGPNTTQTNVSLTFVQSDPELDDRVMKSMLLHPDKRCSEDPAVHRAAAKLSAAVISAEGILSFLTLGWWSQYSDRVGRKKVLAISSFTALVPVALLFLVAFNAEILPGGYRILILGGVVHGLSGGSSVVAAVYHAYLADCSSPSARSRIFSYWAGCKNIGAALGPSLGSLLNSRTNNLLSIFYIAAVSEFIHLIFLAFIIPESLSNEAQTKARGLYEADMKPRPQTILGPLWRLTSIMRPLGLFVPRRLPAGRRRRGSRDWSLTLVGVAAAAAAINVGSYQFKYQYTIKTFHWSSVQLGYWLSLVGFWRTVYSLIILPAILKALHAREERLSTGSGRDDEKEAQIKKIDLLVARASLLAEISSYIIMGIVTSQIPFIGATIILAFDGGFAPSVQSLALALANPSAQIARREARDHGASISSDAKQEIGRLFGALGVIRSLGAQVIGPALFGGVFSATVGVYPRALFWLSALILAVALIALSAIRLDVGTTDELHEHESLLA